MTSDSASDPYVKSSRRWYALGVLLLIYSCHYLDRSIVGVLVEPIKAEFALSDSQMGLLTGLAYGAAFALVGIPMGILADRGNRRTILASILVVWSGLTALSGFVQSYAQLLLARAGVGAAESGGSPTAMSMISDIFPPNQRSTAVGFFFLSTAVGLLLANAAGGLIAEHHGWRAAFWAAGAPGIVLALVLLFTVPEPKRGRHEAAGDKAGLFASIGFILQHKTLRPLFTGMILWAFCAASGAAFTVAFLQRSHGMSIAEAGFVSAIASGAFGAIGAATGGMISDRLAKRSARLPCWFLSAGSAATATLALAAIFAPTIALCAVFLMLWHLVAGFYLGPSYGLAISLAPPRMRATTISVLQVGANLLGYGAGPFLTGVLSDAFRGPDSLRHSMAVIVSIYFIVALLFAFAARSAPREAGAVHAAAH